MKTTLWIILGVVVLLAAGFGLYTQLVLKHQSPIPMQAAVRLKIPPARNSPTTFSPAPNSPTTVSIEKPSIQPEPGQDEKEDDVATNNNSDLVPSEPVTALPEVPQMVTGPAESENNMPPQAVHAPVDAGENAMEKQDETKPSANPGLSAPFSIQVGAFRTKTYADQTESQLMEKGYDAYIFQRTDKKERVWYFVRFGHFQDRATADQSLKVFKDRERMEADIVLTH